jgi:transglutaminase-like putative cysteine protease
VKLKISHTNTYSYDTPVDYALQQIRLTPTKNKQQTVLDWSVDIEGGIKELSFDDQHGNHTMTVSIDRGKNAIEVRASGTVETHDNSGILGMVHGCVPLWHFMQFTDRTKPGKQIRALSKTIKMDKQLECLHALSSTILSAASYQKGQTFVDTTAEEALVLGSGVCQDHAQIFISAARQAGIPARYVSGYLMMNDRVKQDATHAWAEAYVDKLGWVGFDVSNGISPDERYVRIATGLDSKEASPISGIRLGSAAESMIVSLQIQQ